MDDFKLDFSKLDAIGHNKDDKKENTINGIGEDENEQETENKAQSDTSEAIAGLKNTAKGYKAKNHAKNTKEKGRDYVRKSETMRAKIAKDVAAGKDDMTLLLESMYCIFLMTGDRTLFNQIINDLKTNHDAKTIDKITEQFDL